MPAVIEPRAMAEAKRQWPRGSRWWWGEVKKRDGLGNREGKFWGSKVIGGEDNGGKIMAEKVVTGNISKEMS
jgi:hypothetical protein